MSAVSISVSESVALDATSRSRGPRVAALVLASALGAIVATAGMFWWSSRTTDRGASIRELVEASRLVEQRTVEARVTGGFAWKAFRTRSGEAGSNDLRLLAAAMSVVHDARLSPTTEDDSAAATGYLLAGKPDEAARLLEEIVRRTPTPSAWNDLAAAHYTVAVTQDDPSRLGKALAAADAALRLDASLPEARFNRALIIERLGLRDHAHQSWRSYIAADTGSDWANEARQHLRALVLDTPFQDHLERTYETLATDASAVDALAAKFPQDARRWGETEILGRWAAAELSGDREAAAKHLRIARGFGTKLAADRGDRMLASAVDAIDRADEKRRGLLAQGHIDFREAQKLYRASKAAAAQPIFVRATEALDAGGSPIARLAEYFTASTIFVAGRSLEARVRFESLLATAPSGLPALRAQVQWELGRVYAFDGRWGDALDTLKESVETFTRLGETNHAATVREIVAEIHDRTGSPKLAWRERMIALSELGRQSTPRLQIAIASMTRSAIANGDLAEAASFLDLELAITKDVTPVRRVDMLLLRAQIDHELGRNEIARQDLAAARAEIDGLQDASISAFLRANSLLVEAMLAPSPYESIRLLDAAAEAHRSGGRTIFLPEVLLQRGRAYAAAGDRAQAAADYESAVSLLETMREALPSGSGRWGLFDTASELFEEAIDLALERNDHTGAWSYAERARARQLLDSLGATTPATRALSIPAGTVLLEYFAMKTKLVIFTIDARGVQAVVRPITRSTLTGQVAAFADALGRDDQQKFLTSSESLHRSLIEPVAAMIEPKSTLVVIADSALTPVSFAALVDREGRYLIEKHDLVVSPSAAVYERLSRRPARSSTASRLLIVANPALDSTEQPPLPSADREAEKIAGMYSDVTSLSGAKATASAFRREAPEATTIHFAGHAISSGGRDTALVLSREGDRDGRMDAESIAALDLEKTSLVVLAGCNTARGETRLAEGTISVARAFVAAGVPRVIATLQPIEDESASDFFIRLHDFLADGVPPAKALRAVQQEWIRMPGVKRATWAAVQLIGS